ncbi:hypothetical protein CLV59_107153 [Chitinophaga dinghuensis]|uniref:Zn-dependent protease DUF2268 n=1 Tax=Chitinophaga dinghuensis TaxID=1539050 RepID=A0A327VS60_9BACT|nr:hypothetical protein [Chitinophaga dinghuensis]RAJ77386.1 hypothetical protein CLV59_107153 [Chitinophaga dinghuensis]
MKKCALKLPLLILICTLINILPVNGQNSSNIYISDIDHFWEAFDAVHLEPDSAKQVQIMKTLYTDKATPGLKQFMEVRRFDAAKLVDNINKHPKFWASIRPNTLRVKEKIPAIETAVKDFRKIYPELRDAKMYFTITATRSAGTVQDSISLIGTELATGNKYTDVSEFPDNRLVNFFKNQEADNILMVAVHEYVHTQQHGEGKILLGQALSEGACDFIAEKVLKTTLTNSYLVYGRNHEDTLKTQFKQEMMGTDYSNWLYNGAVIKTMGDLGYFMGYVICKSYFAHAKDKKKAIKDIITLNYADQTAILKFLDDSKYYQ